MSGVVGAMPKPSRVTTRSTRINAHLNVLAARQHAVDQVPFEVTGLDFDNGSEFAAFAKIARGLDCSIYFADTHSPWQRGTCENTIGLLRQYIPKGTSGRHLTNAQLQAIENKLNNRPRKCLGYKTPAEVLLGADPPVALRT